MTNQQQEESSSDSDLLRFANTKLLIPSDYPDFFEVEPEVVMANMYDNFQYLELYRTILDKAHFFKKHGIEPVFLANEAGTAVIVTTKAHFNNKLN